MSTLRVSIAADGVTREFSADGDGPVVVSAFRVWLERWDAPMAHGADPVDQAASAIQPLNEEPAIAERPKRPRKMSAAAEPSEHTEEPKATTPSTRAQVRGLIAGVFLDGDERTLFDIHKAVGARSHKATIDDTRVVLSQMVVDGALDVRQVGTERRYRKRESVAR